MAVGDLGNAAVFSSFALGLEFCDEEADVLHGGGARGVLPRFPLFAIAQSLFALQLLEPSPIVPFSSFSDGGAPFVALGLLLASGLADGEERLHFCLALFFELGFSFWELDDGVNAASLAFSRNDLLGRTGFWVVGW